MRRVCVLAVVLLAFVTSGTSAQEFRGSISGRVTDTSKGRMPGATVTATNIETNVPSATTTNGEGDYSILYLTPGMYTLSVELSGFKKMSREGLQVRIGDRLAVDGVLEVGRMEETVTVTAESPLLDTRSGIGRPGHRREGDLADAPVGRQPVRARAARPRRRLQRRLEVLAAVRQRRHLGHRRRRCDRRQRVHARRIAQHGQRPPRGVRAARGRRVGVQGLDGELRRGSKATRPAPA